MNVEAGGESILPVGILTIPGKGNQVYIFCTLVRPERTSKFVTTHNRQSDINNRYIGDFCTRPLQAISPVGRFEHPHTHCGELSGQHVSGVVVVFH